MNNHIEIRELKYPEHLLSAWKKSDYSLLENSNASDYIKAILLKKAILRPGRRFFGEAFVASKLHMVNGWYNSFKWLTAKKWLTGIGLEPIFEEPFYDALIFHFGFNSISNLQKEARSFFENNSSNLNRKKPVAPDLWIIDRNGDHYFIECKLPRDHIAPHQKAGLVLIRDNLKSINLIKTFIFNLYPE